MINISKIKQSSKARSLVLKDKAQKCINMMNWLTNKGAHQYCGVSWLRDTETAEIVNNINHIVGNIKFIKRNKKSVIFDFRAQKCSWKASYRLSDWNTIIDTKIGSMSWVSGINALYDSLLRLATINIKFRSRRELEPVFNGMIEAATREKFSEQFNIVLGNELAV